MNQALIAGVGFTEATAPHKQSQSREELCREATTKALEHAGIEPSAFDAIVVGSIDGTEPTALAGRHLSRTLGLSTTLPVFVVNTGGATGATLPHVASQLVRGGGFSTVLCLGPPTFDGVIDFQATLSTIFKAVDSPLGIGPLHIGALFGATYQQRFDVADRDFAAVAAKARDNAAANPYAHLRKPTTVEDVLGSPMLASPLRLGMICPVSSTACALVITDDGASTARRNPPVRIRAIASTADTGRLDGRRDLSALNGLAMLARRVFRAADITDPAGELDLLELFSPYACFELMQYEALGLCAPGQGGDLLRSGATSKDGALPVNLSGGPLCTNAGVASELAPFGYVALQLMGQAAGHQRDGARRGVAHSMGSSWFACNSLAVLERCRDEED